MPADVYFTRIYIVFYACHGCIVFPRRECIIVLYLFCIFSFICFGAVAVYQGSGK